MESFEYIDRDCDSRIIQVGMFEKITKETKLSKNDRFICPLSKDYYGIIDKDSMKPVLLFVKEVRDIHIIHTSIKNGKGNPCIAWDLCYKLRDDI